MIRFHDTTKIFDRASRPALDAVTATVKPGVITGLVGPDGAGKTTALRMIAGLLKPTSGRIEVFGLDAWRDRSTIRSFLGYMPQKFGLYEDLSVLENLTLYAKLRNLPKSQRKEQFAKLLDFTGLGRFQNRLARRLSGGMKQKLGLACAFVTTPKLLILDEPGVGVDPLSRRELWKMTRTLSHADTIVLWSTSYMDEAALCDETLLFNDGRLLFAGPPQELASRMRDRVFKAHGFSASEKRRLVTSLALRTEVVDATIQGSSVRASFHNQLSPIVASQRFFNGREVETTAPNFEDGFIDILSQETPKRAESTRAHGSTQRVHVPDAFDRDEIVVEARKLTKRFGSFTAASEIEFSIKRGEVFGLLGPNGAGKSTSFKMLCGLLKPTSGDGFVSGVSLRRSSSEARKRLGYMAQKFSLYPNLTVEQNLEFYGGVYGLGLVERRRRIARALEEYELGEYARSASGELPLGYKQRLALATATLHSPEALFLDEPTSGVDPLARREFWRRVDQFASQGVAVLVTTHFMDEAEYCDQIALILDGKKIAQGSPETLKASARSHDNPDPTLEDAFIHLIQRGREVGNEIA